MRGPWRSIPLSHAIEGNLPFDSLRSLRKDKQQQKEISLGSREFFLRDSYFF